MPTSRGLRKRKMSSESLIDTSIHERVNQETRPPKGADSPRGSPVDSHTTQNSGNRTASTTGTRSDRALLDSFVVNLSTADSSQEESKVGDGRRGESASTDINLHHRQQADPFGAESSIPCDSFSKVGSSEQRGLSTDEVIKVLILAPQPFYQERGTPIAVRALIESLVDIFPNLKLTVLTYHEGEDIAISGVTFARVKVPYSFQSYLSHIKPGPSLKKIVCDVLFAASAFKIVMRERRKGRGIRLVHAVEESVFIALVMRLLMKIPYVYDMDSLLAEQLVQRWRLLAPLAPLLSFLERQAVIKSNQILAVCDALAERVTALGGPKAVVLRDFSLLDEESLTSERTSELDPTSETPGISEDIRTSCQVAQDELVLLYVGNLEYYQGIELLLEAFCLACPMRPVALVIVGGTPQQISGFRTRFTLSPDSHQIGAQKSIHFVGPRPLNQLGSLLSQADILASPRILGGNTPMKIYSYLHSGKPIIATAIESHTQVLDTKNAMLVPADPRSFAAGLELLVEDEARRLALGNAAKKLAEEKYHRKVFRQTLASAYTSLLERLS